MCSRCHWLWRVVDFTPLLWSGVVVSLQTLCECALNSPYIILKLGMMAVLSTLSGTIAIKQYLSNMTGSTIFTPRLCEFFFVTTKNHVFVLFFLSPVKYGLKNYLWLWKWFQWYFLSPSGSTSVPPRLTDLVKLAQECCFHSNLGVAAHGVKVLSNIVISCPEKG